MLSKFVKQLSLPKIFSSLLGVSSISYTMPNYGPKEMILKSQIFLHACKTPLTVIKCCTDDLASNAVNDKNKRIVDGLQASIKELSALFNAASGPTDLENSTFNIRKVTTEVIAILKWKFPKALICNEIDPKIDLVGNKLYFEEALRCVATNALEAYRPDARQHLCLVARKRRNSIQFDIIDMASGMSETAKKLALFGGFSYKANGSGVGLNFANYTIEKMFRGKVHILTQGQVGTRITWMLPLPKPPNVQTSL